MSQIAKLVDKTHSYMFPADYCINLHHSHFCINTLLTIRIVSFLYLTPIFIWSFMLTKSSINLFIYLTMNGYFFTWLYFALVLQDYYLNAPKAKNKGKNAFPIANNLKYYIQLIYQVAFAIQLPITLVFWSVLFKILISMEGITTQQIILNVNLHGGPLLCLLVDVAYNTCQFPRKHYWSIIVSSTVYMVINMTYSLAVKPIYKPIDWVSFFSYVLLVVSFGLSYLMHWFGRFLFKRIKKKRLENRIIEGLIENNYISKNTEDMNGKQRKHSTEIKEIGMDSDLNVSVLTDDLQK